MPLVATNYAWLLIIWFLNFLHWKKKFYQTKQVAMLTLVGWKKLLFHESMVWRLWVIKIDIMGSQIFFSCVCVLFRVLVFWFIWFIIVFRFVLSFVVFMFHVLFFYVCKHNQFDKTFQRCPQLCTILSTMSWKVLVFFDTMKLLGKRKRHLKRSICCFLIFAFRFLFFVCSCFLIVSCKTFMLKDNELIDLAFVDSIVPT